MTLSTVQPRRSGFQSASAPYVVPFAFFLLVLVAAPHLAFLGVWEFPLRVSLLVAVLFAFSRHVIDFRVRHGILTIVVGVAVFVLWIAPDVLFPNYREHWLFQNAITGSLSSSLGAEARTSWLALSFRVARAALLVPIIEELFWRAWLFRWLQSPNFESIPLGHWTWSSMLITVLLFASEHGPYWEVGLMAGFAYNWLMIRTKSLGDCILAHAITNGCLSAWVIATGQWEYWM
jgi:CAAX prenyl protease-like protein